MAIQAWAKWTRKYAGWTTYVELHKKSEYQEQPLVLPRVSHQHFIQVPFHRGAAATRATMVKIAKRLKQARLKLNAIRVGSAARRMLTWRGLPCLALRRRGGSEGMLGSFRG
jgi:hypothetical protein